MTTHSSWMYGAAAMASALLIAGCGGGSSSNGASAAAPTTDAFLAQVTSTVGASSDATEAPSIDAIAATSPEDNEPIPVT